MSQRVPGDAAPAHEPCLFWTDDGWLVDLREYRSYPNYGEWDWVARTNNVECDAVAQSQRSEP